METFAQSTTETVLAAPVCFEFTGRLEGKAGAGEKQQRCRPPHGSARAEICTVALILMLGQQAWCAMRVSVWWTDSASAAAGECIRRLASDQAGASAQTSKELKTSPAIHLFLMVKPSTH